MITMGCPISKKSQTDELGMAHCAHSKRPDHDAVYTFDLKIAQDRGLLCDYFVHHAIRSIGVSCETSQFGD